MKKKFFAMLMAVVLCVGMLPTGVLADSEQSTVEEFADADAALEDDSVGSGSTKEVVDAAEQGATEIEEDASEAADSDEAAIEEADSDVDVPVDIDDADEDTSPEETAPVTYRAETDGVIVEVTAPGKALPEDAQLTVRRYAESSVAYKDVAEAIDYEADDENGMAAVDISFVSGGEEVEPTEAVQVRMDVSAILPKDADVSTLEVQHLIEDGNGVHPVIAANASSVTEGTVDTDKAVAGFEVDSFSAFTVTWTIASGPASGTTYSVSVTAYLDGTELDDVNPLKFDSENDELDLITLLSDVDYGSGDYTFSYAIVSVRSGNNTTTYGTQDNPVIAIEIYQGSGGPTSSSNFLLVYSDGTTGTVSTSNVSVEAHYVTPDFSVSIETVDEDETTEAWALQAVLSHAGTYESIHYDWTVTDIDGSASQWARVTNTDNTGRAYISWEDGVEDNTDVIVTVTATITLADGSTKTATANYVLEYGDETVDLIMTYGPNKTALPAGVTVTLTSGSGEHVYSGETDSTGWVHDLEIEPGVYTVTASYIDSTGSTYRCSEKIALHDAGNYTINLNYYNEEIRTNVPSRTSWEHIDIKLSVGTSSDSDSGAVSIDIIGAQILGSDGTVKYTATSNSIEGNDNEFQLLFYSGTNTTGSSSHSVSFSTEDTISITYVLTINGVEQDAVTIYINANTLYDEGSTYPANGQRAYKLYNYLYGTSYSSNAQMVTDGVGDIDISGMSMMLVASILCDSSVVTGAGSLDTTSTNNQWGMDFALSIEALNALAASWAFDIEKTYENASMTAGDFVFELYGAEVNREGEWTTSGDPQSTLTNQTSGMNWDGNSYDTMELFSISYSDEAVQKGESYYYILYEVPGTVTSASGATIVFDETIFGVMVQLGTDELGAATVTATYYRMEKEGQGTTYYIAETYTTGTDVPGKITFDADDYATFAFKNSYQSYTELSGEKIWEDNDNVDHIRPESITINLLANGEQAYDDEGMPITTVVTAAEEWKWSFEELPLFDGVTELVYSIEEVSVDGYDTTIVENADGTYTITNTHTPFPEPEKDVDIHGDGTYGDNGEGVQVGDTLTYEITYDNVSDEPATVTITDMLDVGLDFKTATAGGTYDEDSHTITWVFEAPAHFSGSVTFTAIVNENALEKNEVENTACVQVGDDPAVDTNTVYNPVPDKNVDADGDGTYDDSGILVKVGGTVVYKIDYENPDDDPATVTITDEVDAGLDFVSATDNGSYEESSRTITWVITDVEPHANGSVYFTAIVNETALVKHEVDNTATVQVGNHAEQQTKTVYNPVGEDPEKDVDSDSDGSYGDNGKGVQVGDTMTYEITYFNSYRQEAAVTITDTLDIGLDFVEASDGGIYDESTRTITWDLTADAKAGGSVTFTAIVNENALEKNEVENTASVQVGDDPAVDTNTVYNPVPDKNVDADGDGTYDDSGMLVKVGGTVVYKIDYENPDDDPATVTITDEVDAGLDFVSATDNGSYEESSRTITWVITDVEPHANGSVYFTAIVNETALVKHEVENTATVQVGNHAEQQTKTVCNPVTTERVYFPIDEEIVPDESDPDTWVKNESVNEYNAIELEMSTNLPIIVPAELAEGSFVMYFHNQLVSELNLDEADADFSVYIAGIKIDHNYYTVTIAPDDDCSFHVDVDLTALYTDGVISDEELLGDTVIQIFFYADLEGMDLNGSYTSTVWYDVYDGDDWEYTSNEDVVEVYTYEIEILKYDTETGNGLAGATLGVYYDEDCTEPVYRYVGKGFDETEKQAYTVTSGEAGYAIFYGLAEGTFYVRETEAPEGYVLSDEVLTVELSEALNDSGHVYSGEYANTPEEVPEPETVDVNGSKTWDDNNDQDGKRPASITINLLANGKVIDSVTVNEANDWAWSFTDLDKYALDGNEIIYSIMEETVTDYTTTYDGYDVTNSYTPGKVSVPVTKVWNDDDDIDGIRPASVNVELFKNGESTGRILVLGEDNNWSGSFDDLDEYNGGMKNVYTVQEQDVEGYTAEITGDAETGFVVTNKHIPHEETTTGPGPEVDTPAGGSTGGTGDTGGPGGTSDSGNTGATGSHGSTGSTSSPGSTSGTSAAKTDDTGNAGLWLVLVVIAAAAAVGSVTVRTRKTKQSRR